MSQDLILCHGKKDYVIKGTNPNICVFAGNDTKKFNFDVKINLFKTSFKPCKMLFDRVFILCRPEEVKSLVETDHFIVSIANVLKTGGYFILPNEMFLEPNITSAMTWTNEIWKPKIKSYFFVTPRGFYDIGAYPHRSMIMFKRK